MTTLRELVAEASVLPLILIYLIVVAAVTTADKIQDRWQHTLFPGIR